MLYQDERALKHLGVKLPLAPSEQRVHDELHKILDGSPLSLDTAILIPLLGRLLPDLKPVKPEPVPDPDAVKEPPKEPPK